MVIDVNDHLLTLIDVALSEVWILLSYKEFAPLTSDLQPSRLPQSVQKKIPLSLHLVDKCVQRLSSCDSLVCSDWL